MSTADKLKTVADNVQKVYNAGAKSSYDEFWDAIQAKGKRVNYEYAFVRWGGNNIFKPKYSITPTNATYMFFQSGSNTENGLEMDKLEQELGIKFDFSNVHNLGFTFADAGFWKTLNVIDMTGTTGPNEYAFYDGYGGQKTRINKLIVNENTKFHTGTFGYCYSLTHIIVEGTIGQNGFDVHWSGWLSKKSIVSIINALSSTATSKTVTLSKTAVNTAFETSKGAKDGAESEEWLNLISQKSNWTITLS